MSFAHALGDSFFHFFKRLGRAMVASATDHIIELGGGEAHFRA